jgi:hypothetical protein
MANTNIEAMKKIIEEKKKKSSEQGGIPRATGDITEIRDSFKKKKKGGLFDK